MQFRLVRDRHDGRSRADHPVDPTVQYKERDSRYPEKTRNLGGVCTFDMADHMSLRMSDARERRLEDLQEALNENTKSKAIDRAARFTVRMRGGTTAVPQGAIAELLERAEQQRNVTVEEIAEVRDTDDVPVDAETAWSIGEQ
jgi:hypothetical protein